MIWTFIKKRWFSVALVMLVLIALVRKNLRINVGDSAHPSPKEQLDKYTNEPSVAQNTSLLGISTGGSPATHRLPEIADATAIAFLKRFSEVAVTEQERFGMPASVLLACAYVNSFAGQRDCATGANNYLATHCSANWDGAVVTLSGTCFKQYETAWESIRDFNVQLSSRDWYRPLCKSAGQDWQAWAKGMSSQQVSDVENFEQELVSVIRRYRLFELDQ